MLVYQDLASLRWHPAAILAFSISIHLWTRPFPPIPSLLPFPPFLPFRLNRFRPKYRVSASTFCDSNRKERNLFLFH